MWDVGHNHRGNSGQLRKRDFFHGRDYVWIMNGRKTNLRRGRDFTFGERSQVWQIQFHCLRFPRHNVSPVGKCHPWAMESFDICKVNFSIRKMGFAHNWNIFSLGGNAKRTVLLNLLLKRNFNCPDQPVSGVVHSSWPNLAHLPQTQNCWAGKGKVIVWQVLRSPRVVLIARILRHLKLDSASRVWFFTCFQRCCYPSDGHCILSC